MEAEKQPKTDSKKDAQTERQHIYIKILGKDAKIQSLKDELVKSIAEIPKQRYTDLRSFILSGNSYGVEIFKRLGQILEEAVDIDKIDVSDCFIGRSAIEVNESLYVISKPVFGRGFTHVDISNNMLGAAGGRSVAQILERATHLRYFNATNCGLGTLGAKELIDRMVFCQALQFLSFGKNRIGTDGGIFLSQSLRFMPNLKAFYLFQNGIKKSGTIAIFKELRLHCQFLETLDVADNFLNEQSTTELIELVKRPNSKLHSLNLSDALEPMEAGYFFYQGLGVPKPLIWQRLGFSYVELQEQRVQELLGILNNCNSLRHLQLLQTNFPKHFQKAYNDHLARRLGQPIIFYENQDQNIDSIVGFGDVKVMK